MEAGKGRGGGRERGGGGRSGGRGGCKGGGGGDRHATHSTDRKRQTTGVGWRGKEGIKVETPKMLFGIDLKNNYWV